MRKAHIVQLRAFVEPPTERLRTAAPKTVRTRVNDVQLKSRSYPKKSDNNLANSPNKKNKIQDMNVAGKQMTGTIGDPTW